MGTRLWSVDKYGERWLENGGTLVIANKPPKKGKRKMAKLRRGSAAAKAHMRYVSSFRKKGKSNRSHSRKRRSSSRRRSSAKSNYYSAGMIANPGRRRRAKSNPGGGRTFNVFGVQLPALDAVGGAVGGLLLPPIAQGLANRFIPASISANPIGSILVRAGSVIVPGMIVKKFVSRTAGNMIMAVGLGVILAEKLQGFIPTLTGMGAQPFLGQYMGQYLGAAPFRLPGPVANMRARVPMTTSRINAGIPDRLQADSRY